ncbi:hypothetical protein B0A49_13600, partial [Cryomyces minteri]
KRLSRKVARHTASVLALPEDHPLEVSLRRMKVRAQAYRSPLYETWLEHWKRLQLADNVGITRIQPYGLAPWTETHDVRCNDSELVAKWRHQELAKKADQVYIVYTDGSCRNKLCGAAVTRLSLEGQPQVKAIHLALVHILDKRPKKANKWIVTDSQEALQLIYKAG